MQRGGGGEHKGVEAEGNEELAARLHAGTWVGTRWAPSLPRSSPPLPISLPVSTPLRNPLSLSPPRCRPLAPRPPPSPPSAAPCPPLPTRCAPHPAPGWGGREWGKAGCVGGAAVTGGAASGRCCLLKRTDIRVGGKPVRVYRVADLGWTW